MEAARLPVVTEELSLFHLTPAQYIIAAQKAAQYLHWQIVALEEYAIVFQTPASEQSAGEVVTIRLDSKKATLHCRPLIDYYESEVLNRLNVELFKQAMAKAAAEQEKTDRNLHPMHREKYGALVPSKSYIITPLAVYANILVFVAMIIAGISPLEPAAQSLLQWGGNLRPSVMAGEWWRLVTYMFLHAGIWHLLMNVYALLYIGMFLEPLMGRFRFASAYLLTGVCAGLMSIGMHAFSVGVGASGAIFGMYGVFLSMLTTSHIERTMRRTMFRSIMFFVVLNLMYGLQGNIDNAAHIGGLLSGLAVGYAYYPGIARHDPLRRQGVVTGLLAAAVILLTVVTAYLLR